MKKIAIVGPESTGKSMLSELLAQHYKTAWVPEYARDYLNNLGRPYEERDLLTIAKGQLQSEDERAKHADGYLFCDTNLVVIKIWSEVKYNRCDPQILQWMQERDYDLHLLTYVDLPWQDDPLREHPEMREHLFNLYEKELARMQAPYEVIKGGEEKRLQNAVSAIDRHFGKRFTKSEI